MNFRLLLLNILLFSTFVFAQNRKVYVDSLFSWDGSGNTISDYSYGIQSKDIATSAVTVADTTALKALTETRAGFQILNQWNNVLYVHIDSTYIENGSGVAFASATAGKQWVALEYLTGNYANVAWSGAASDKSDVTAYFNKVKTFLSTHGGKMIISANTNYALDSFVPSAGMIIEGQTNITYNLSTKQARLYPASDNGYIIKKPTGSTVPNVTIRNINFEGINSATGDTARYGIYVNGGYEWKIEGNNFDYFRSSEGSYCVWVNQVNSFSYFNNDYYRSDVCIYDSLGDGNYFERDRFIEYGTDGVRLINSRNIIFNSCNWNLGGTTFDDNSNGLTLRNAWEVSAYSPYVEIDGGSPIWFNIIQHGSSPIRGNITSLNVYDIHGTSSTAELLGVFNSHEQAMVNMYGGDIVLGGMDSIFVDVKDTITYVCNIKNVYVGTAGGNSQRIVNKEPITNKNWNYNTFLSFNEWRINYTPSTSFGTKNYGIDIFGKDIRTSRMWFENTSANHGNYSGRSLGYRVPPITNVAPVTDSLVMLQIIHQTGQTRYNTNMAVTIDYWLGHATSSSGGEIRQELGYYISKNGGTNHTDLDTIKTWHRYLPNPGTGYNDCDSIKVISQNSDTTNIGFWLNKNYAATMYFQCMLTGDNIGTANLTKVAR